MSEREREPLLPNEDGRRPKNKSTLSRITPLPKQQMTVLCFMTFTEPISEFIIFPFVNEMIVHVGATDDPQKIGYYSGFIESLFYLTAFCTSLFWGQLSDRIGRRPVLLIGLVGIILSSIAFGLSETFTAMVIARCINGLLNGNSPVIRSVAAEITDKTNESLAISLLSLCWSTGAIIAPALGGLLIRPAELFPSIFGNIELFKRYPYLFPCLVGASVSILGLITGTFWLKETLGTEEYSRGDPPSLAPSGSRADFDNDGNSVPAQNASTLPISAWALLQMKNVREVLVASWLFALISVGLQAVWLLWLYTPIQSGGIGLTTFGLGITCSFVGILGTINLLFIFPPLQRRFGSRILFIIAMWGHVAHALLFPIVRLIAVRESGQLHADSSLSPSNAFGSILANFAFTLIPDSNTYLTLPAPTDPGSLHGRPGPATMVGIGAMVIAKAVSDFAFASIALLVNSVTPNNASLGAVNGLMSMISCLMRAFGPIASTTLYAASVSQNLLGGNLFWIALLGVGLSATQLAMRLEKTPSLHDLEVEEAAEEDELRSDAQRD